MANNTASVLKNIDLSKYRAVLDTWNLQGKTICTVTASNMDLLHNDKVKEGKQRLYFPLRKYEVITKDIFAFDLIEMPDTGKIMIQLNHDEDLLFPIGPCEFVEATMQNVAAAIEAKQQNAKTMFFIDLGAVTKCVNTLNKIEKKAIDDLIEEYTGFSLAYDELNRIFTNQSDDYYKSLGLDKE